MELTKTQNVLLEMIEETLGYRVSETILRHNNILSFISINRFNEEDTNKFKSLFDTNSSDDEALEYAFDTLTCERVITQLPQHIYFEIDSLPFSLMTTYWEDNYGEHSLVRLLSENSLSAFSIFDIDSINRQYICSMN